MKKKTSAIAIFPKIMLYLSFLFLPLLKTGLSVVFPAFLELFLAELFLLDFELLKIVTPKII
jgi:hypothetical protein